VLIIRAFLKVIIKKSTNMFESDFVTSLRIYCIQEHLGQALLGPDRLVL
jgi:hypothetical protein